MRGFERGLQLRLEAAARLLDLAFRSSDMSQNCWQPLWSQEQESKQNHEHDFRSKTHDLLLGQALIAGDNGYDGGWLFLFGSNGRLKAADAFSDSFAKFWQLLWAENQQGNSKNNQQMHRLK
jgi:hypothetical protein